MMSILMAIFNIVTYRRIVDTYFAKSKAGLLFYTILEQQWDEQN
jgi:hypothetical protein